MGEKGKCFTYFFLSQVHSTNFGTAGFLRNMFLFEFLPAVGGIEPGQLGLPQPKILEKIISPREGTNFNYCQTKA